MIILSNNSFSISKDIQRFRIAIPPTINFLSVDYSVHFDFPEYIEFIREEVGWRIAYCPEWLTVNQLNRLISNHSKPG